jgi:hypothetical protein
MSFRVSGAEEPRARSRATNSGRARSHPDCRSRQLRWGATDEEFDATLAGDGLIPNADLTATRAITISAAAEDVWPWLAQLGQGRGGFYTYDWLENLVGADIHSADHIEPEWHDPEVGDQVHLAADVALTGSGTRPGDPWRHIDGTRGHPIRLHLGLGAATATGRDDPAGGAREVRLHAAVGLSLPPRACGCGQFRDDATNASRHQGSRYSFCRVVMKGHGPEKQSAAWPPGRGAPGSRSACDG